MALQSGTLFLLELHRRALGDGRLHVLEATATAALLGALASVRIDEYGFTQFGNTSQVLWGAAAAGGLWCGISIALLSFTRAECKFYAYLTLLESGLLYLALEHEPAELLPGLRRGTHWSRLAANPAGSLNFSARMQALLRCYPACLRALNYQPYPAWVRYTAVALLALALGLLALALYTAWGMLRGWLQVDAVDYVASMAADEVAGDASQSLRLLLLSSSALYLLRVTLSQGQRTGVMLGLVEALYGEVQPGRAVLTRG